MFKPIADFIQQQVTFHHDNQLVDIGGGTAQISLLIQEKQGLTKPIVCVDPSQDMLDVAVLKGDVVGVCATAEEFLSSQPNYSLDIVLMVNCVHHFSDIGAVFSNLASFMPDKGVCIITVCDARTLPYFKAAKEKYIGLEGERLQELRQVLEANGLQLEMVSDSTKVEMSKASWYNLLRSRHDSGLWRFSDEQLEKGIEELDAEYKDVDSFHFDYVTKGFIISKK